MTEAKDFLDKFLAEHKDLDLRLLLSENTSVVRFPSGFSDVRKSTLTRETEPGNGQVEVAIKTFRVPFDSDPSFAKVGVNAPINRILT